VIIQPLRRAAVRLQFGSLRRVQPLGEWGFERGTPVDRYYIEQYLDRHAGLVRGHALEVDNNRYSTRYGATSIDIVDIDPDNPQANVVGDLSDVTTLRPATYDVAVVTQTLQLVSKPLDALRNLAGALRPGGSLLVTVPAISRLANPADRWRWTPLGMLDLLMEAAPPGAEVESVGLGNGLAARAFLFALAVEDLDEAVLEATDADYPLIVGARITVP
jgi:SAM-dependent methyltransferase